MTNLNAIVERPGAYVAPDRGDRLGAIGPLLRDRMLAHAVEDGAQLFGACRQAQFRRSDA